ncbi:squalene synthase HpnC [Streptomyces sp. NBC_01795]|uniref:squalene synthase HpnC n=1 Tax=Streptomyces sp. NBC_01795 TaxID=2975943 RepID=UPI002DD899A7|nr:squalene synthase HpnC [Streptomyces sp. NBC_01795]WSA91085.1 squalene synthase HpnC [Streptomyces sp. NBC_01795]
MVTAEEDAHTRAVLSQAKTENFPVAPRFLPREWRNDLMAVYGFARLVDDIGDSDLTSGPAHAAHLGLPADQADDPLAMLDAFESDLHRVFAPAGPEPGHPLLRALVPTVRGRALAPEPFLALIEANRQDQKVRRYATYAELLAYCELSANPVGHLVLAITGTATPERVRLSDAVCTGLQIVEHLQDVAEDLARDRVYLPAEDMDRFRVGEGDLAAPTANASVRALIAFETERALGLLDEGTPLVRSVHGRLRLLLAGFTGGGRAAAGALRAARYDVLAGAPRAGALSVARESWASLRGEG